MHLIFHFSHQTNLILLKVLIILLQGIVVNVVQGNLNQKQRNLFSVQKQKNDIISIF